MSGGSSAGYQPIPSSPWSTTTSSDLSTPPSSVSSNRRSQSGTRQSSLLSSPLPRGLRFRPIPIIIGTIILLMISGPILHPTTRSHISTYISSSSSSSSPTIHMSYSSWAEYDSSQSSSSSFKYKFPHNSPNRPFIPPPTGGLDPSVIPLTLETRLQYLLARPELNQWEVEYSNRYKCPFYTYNRNTYFFHVDGNKAEQWEALNSGDVARYRHTLVDYLRKVEKQGEKLVWEDGMDSHVPKNERRGLIFTAGDGPALERLKLVLHMLRNVIKSKIIIHVYHFQGELTESGLKDDIAKEFDLKFVEVGGRRADGKSWNIKNIAFLHTQFTEFVYMDSDNIPLIDPLELFDSVEYKQSGSAFWSDLNKDHPDNAIFRIMGRDCSDEHWPAESGQLIFDKRGNNGLNLAVLHLSAHMMEAEHMYGFLGYGDKDTFRFGFYALGLPYQMAPKQYASAGGFQNENGEDSKEFCGHTMLQWSLTPSSQINNPSYHPKPAFLHAILAKHKYNLQPEKLFTHIRKPRLDMMTEPLLIRTYYEWTGQCFGITLKGPDGSIGMKGSLNDGQAVDLISIEELLGDNIVWGELQSISRTFVNIKH